MRFVIGCCSALGLFARGAFDASGSTAWGRVASEPFEVTVGLAKASSEL